MTSDSSTGRKKNPARTQETIPDTPPPPPVVVEELSEEEAEEIRGEVNRPMTLEQVALELSKLHRRVKWGRIDVKRAWFLKDLLLAVAQVVKPLEEIRELRQLNERLERAEARERQGDYRPPLADDLIERYGPHGRPRPARLRPSTTDGEEGL